MKPCEDVLPWSDCEYRTGGACPRGIWRQESLAPRRLPAGAPRLQLRPRTWAPRGAPLPCVLRIHTTLPAPGGKPRMPMKDMTSKTRRLGCTHCPREHTFPNLLRKAAVLERPRVENTHATCSLSVAQTLNTCWIQILQGLRGDTKRLEFRGSVSPQSPCYRKSGCLKTGPAPQSPPPLPPPTPVQQRSETCTKACFQRYGHAKQTEDRADGPRSFLRKPLSAGVEGKTQLWSRSSPSTPRTDSRTVSFPRTRGGAHSPHSHSLEGLWNHTL